LWQSIDEVRSIKYLDFEEELVESILKYAREDISVKSGPKRFLIGIPLAVLKDGLENQGVNFSDIKKLKEFLIQSVQLAKDKFRYKEFILCDGEVDGKPVKSLNCVAGFYEVLQVKGSQSNPSPQMAAWSYLKFIIGPILRDELIADFTLREEGIERTYDDPLESKIELKFK
jgi:hypothetical protein